MGQHPAMADGGPAMNETAEDRSTIITLRVSRSLKTALLQAARADGVSLSKWATGTLSAVLARIDPSEYAAEAEAVASMRVQYARRRAALVARNKIEE